MLYVDGTKIRSFSKADEVLSHDAFFIKGDAVYTSLRTYRNNPFQLDRHLERLKSSAEAMKFKLTHEIEEIRGWVIRIISEEFTKDQFIKITATPRHTVVTWQDLDIDQEAYKGVRTVTQPLVRKNVKVKSTNREDLEAAYDVAREAGCHEALLLNPKKEITEGTRTNIFRFQDNVLFWCDDALSGITQEAVIEIAGKLGIAVQQAALPYDQLGSIDELFLTRTSTGPVPVLQVDDKIIGDGKPGAKTLQLMAAFEELTRQNGRKNV